MNRDSPTFQWNDPKFRKFCPSWGVSGIGWISGNFGKHWDLVAVYCELTKLPTENDRIAHTIISVCIRHNSWEFIVGEWDGLLIRSQVYMEMLAGPTRTGKSVLKIWKYCVHVRTMWLYAELSWFLRGTRVVAIRFSNQNAIKFRDIDGLFTC